MTWVATSRGRLRRSSILEATLRIIALEGVRAVTHRRVAQEAGSSLGLISYHFQSTEALIAETLKELSAQEAQQMMTLRDRITAASGDADLLVETLVAAVFERGHAGRERTLAGYALTLEIPRLTVDRQSFTAWESALEDACAALCIALGREPQPELVAFLQATMDGLFLNAAIAQSPDDVVNAARAGLRRLLSSLAPRDAGAQAEL